MLLKVCYFPINVIKIQVNDFTLAKKYEFSQSDEMQATLIKDPSVFVKRLAWSPDGTLFGEMQDMDLTTV